MFDSDPHHTMDLEADLASWFKAGIERAATFDVEAEAMCGFGLPSVRNEGEAFSFDRSPVERVIVFRSRSREDALAKGRRLGEAIEGQYRAVGVACRWSRKPKAAEQYPRTLRARMARAIFGPRVEALLVVTPLK
jgi:hypothetical protein